MHKSESTIRHGKFHALKKKINDHIQTQMKGDGNYSNFNKSRTGI